MNPRNHLVKATEEEQPQDQQGYQSLVGSLMYLADRKSTSGFVFCIAGGPISWKSKIQDTVALSTAEAKYVALSSASQECIRIRRLNSEFGNTSEDPTIIMKITSPALLWPRIRNITSSKSILTSSTI